MEVDLIVGVFFDGTGNNANNIMELHGVCGVSPATLSSLRAEEILTDLVKKHKGLSGYEATSYTGYYTNIYWLSKLYNTGFVNESSGYQSALYIEGIGTKNGEPDDLIGLGFGVAETGVIAKTHRAIYELPTLINKMTQDIRQRYPEGDVTIKSFQFDIFGFSRGAAASRHFANLVFLKDPDLYAAIKRGMAGIRLKEASEVKVRFLGLFDTVTAVTSLKEGLNRLLNTGNIKLQLLPGIADNIFQIAAENECRTNFPLNSIKPAWPELSLPGAHSDIGGGYLPLTIENLFLTRPIVDTVTLSFPDIDTRGYQQTISELKKLTSSLCMAPITRTADIRNETWSDEKMPTDRYGQMQKRSYSAVTLRNKIVRHDWSRVALEVMLDAAQKAGVSINSMDRISELKLPDDLIKFSNKAISMGRALRNGTCFEDFSREEWDWLAHKYIHCSAHWNRLPLEEQGKLNGGAEVSDTLGFLNRPGKLWRRFKYSVNGNEF